MRFFKYARLFEISYLHSHKFDYHMAMKDYLCTIL